MFFSLQVYYDEETLTLSFYYGDYGAAFQADNIYANFNNNPFVLSFAPYFNYNEGKLYIPLTSMEKH